MRKFDYEIPQRIEGDEPLIAVFNHALKSMIVCKMSSFPRNFKEFKEENIKSYATIYCECLLLEKWMHEVIERLREWIDKIDEYFNDYEGQWKYYACSKRIESIKEYGGNDDDYDEDGEIITQGLLDEKLKPYTIIADLYYDDWRDLVQETTIEDIKDLRPFLQADAQVSVSDLGKVIGYDIPMYKQNEYGEMVRMTREDEDLMKIGKEVKAEDTHWIISFIAVAISQAIQVLKDMNRCDNNTEALDGIRKLSVGLLNMEFLDA